MQSSEVARRDVSQTMWVAGDEDDVGERHGFLERGDQLGRYLILSRLGTGGMGVVYAAYDPDLDRKVAIKLLRRGSSDPERRNAAQRRLMQEARAMARLAHPNVITVHDVAEFDGRVFVAMEFVDGETLDCVLESKSRDWRDLLSVLIDAGKGLAAAHAAGVVHRDFKPENVMLDRAGRVRVMDFGLAGGTDVQGSSTGQFVGMSPEDIALATGSSRAVDRLTPPEPGDETAPTSVIAGTPAYMSPEQHDARATDARTDQFSFCVTLHEALYGVRPFEGETPAELARAIRSGELRSPPEGSRVPAWIHAVIRRGLSVRPEARYPSMRALLAALRADPAIRRRRWAARGALALLTIGGAFGARQAFVAWTADPCAGAHARMRDAWSDEHRREVEHAFESVVTPYAGDAWRVVSARLDGYAESWLAMHRDACEANKVRGEESDHLLDLRMQCLSRRLAELGALVDLFAEADEPIVRTAVEASYALVPVGVCADLEALLAPVPPPDAAEQRGALEDVRLQLAHVKAYEDGGRLTEALELVAPAVQMARALGYAPLLAEALLQHGRLAWLVTDFDAAEELLREAVQVAAKGKHHDVEARAWLRLVMVVGYGKAKAERGREIEHAAAAAVVRAGGSPELRAELANARGAVALQLNRLDDAEAHFRESLTLERERLGEDHPKVAHALNNTSIVLIKNRRYEEALVPLRAAIGIYERTIGEAHPIVAKLRMNLSSALQALGDYEEAQKQAQRAMEICLRDHGPDHPETALTQLVMSSVEIRLERFEDAKENAANALRILEGQWGEHPHVATSYQQLGIAMRELGEHASAIVQLERAAAIGERTLERTDSQLETIRIDLADAYVRHGRFEAASPLLEKLLAALSPDTPKALAGHVRFLLAQALWASDRDRVRAVELARVAREELTDPSPTAGRVTAAPVVDRWLSGK